MSLLESMGRHATGTQEGSEYQPYQVLNNTARQAREARPSKEVCFRHEFPASASQRILVISMAKKRLCLANIAIL